MEFQRTRLAGSSQYSTMKQAASTITMLSPPPSPKSSNLVNRIILQDYSKVMVICSTKDTWQKKKKKKKKNHEQKTHLESCRFICSTCQRKPSLFTKQSLGTRQKIVTRHFNTVMLHGRAEFR